MKWVSLFNRIRKIQLRGMDITKDFNKNGLTYTMLEKGAIYAMFKQWSMIDKKPIISGYEVSKIYTGINRFSENNEQTTWITSDSQFGIDGSKSFYEEESARKYFETL